MWMVWSYDEGVICQTDNKDEALECYENAKKGYVEGFDGEFYTNEQVIMAKVEKNFYSHDTGKTVYEENEQGEEVATTDTYWDWKEDTY